MSAVFVALWKPSPRWVEQSFTNGYYPHWEHLLAAITAPLPFSLGDLILVIAGASMLWRLIAAVRRRTWRPLATALAIAALLFIWFYAGWGWGYERAPLTNRVAFNTALVHKPQIDALTDLAITQLNRLAPRAHASDKGPLDRAALLSAWLPVVRRLGDRWTPSVGAPKPTIADSYMGATGISGFIDPFSLEVQLGSDLLWFERPFDLAHEWTHVAGFNREDEANYAAAITCLRSPDPRIQYSGWLELFLYLPPRNYKRADFNALVWLDFEAIRARNAGRINLALEKFQWRSYNRYLKSNHIASGVENYNQVVQLLAGIPLDADGLPIAKGTDTIR
ncbi:MAG: DUF3810 family protein [Candidatus Baltobacteraceae bacterium]